MEGMDMDPGKTQRPVYKRDEPRLRLEDSNSSSSEGEVFEPYLLAQGKKQTAEDYALKFLERNAGISREGAQYAIDYHKGKNTFVPRTLLKKVVPVIGETTYTIFCHSGSPKSYHLPPLGRIYVDDINIPNQTFGYLLRSPHANAQIISIEIEEAKLASGVIGILTGKDYLAAGLGPMPHSVSKTENFG